MCYSRMCVLFYFYFVCLYFCEYAFNSKVHCGSALRPGASGLPYYCTPLVCVPGVIGTLAVWREKSQKNKIQSPLDFDWQSRMKLGDSAVATVMWMNLIVTKVNFVTYHIKYIVTGRGSGNIWGRTGWGGMSAISNRMCVPLGSLP